MIRGSGIIHGVFGTYSDSSIRAKIYYTTQNNYFSSLFSLLRRVYRTKKEFLLPASSRVLSARANVVVIHIALLVLVRHHGWFVVHHISRETSEISQFRCHVLSVKVEHI